MFQTPADAAWRMRALEVFAAEALVQYLEFRLSHPQVYLGTQKCNDVVYW